MPEINILDKTIYNRIAAGEVVDGPYSVVKELVENSIDAGADFICVEITGGGIESISVTDNGKGISKEDIPRAFLPHATSKIKSIDDLNAIGTLGFRGEALPSIASVAKVSVTSKQATDRVGYSVTYENGKPVAEGEKGAADGTVVCVQGLFRHIPARYKFLKKPAAETARVTDLIEKFILSNPDIAFQYIANDKTVYRTDGAGTESAVYAVYKNATENFLPISCSMSGITLRGYVSEPNFSRHNRNYQTLVVNSRVVENEDIAYSIFMAYKDFLMTRKFPIYIIYIDLPYDLIDVNVHPNKMTVKFVDPVLIKKLVYNTVHRAISALPAFPSLTGKEFLPVQKTENPGVETFAEVRLGQNKNVSEYKTEYPAPLKPLNDIFCESRQENILSRKAIMEFFYGKEEQLGEAAERHGGEYGNNVASDKKTESYTKQFAPVAEYNKTQVAGKLFNTYLVVQAGDDIYFIDQHAAHERILYDTYLAEIDRGKPIIQELLIPYTFSVSYTEAELIKENSAILSELGFWIAPFGESTFSLSAVPAVLSGMQLKEFVSELLSDPNRMLKKSDFLKQKVAQSACKAAVKGKDDLSESEISSLISKMNASGSAPLCPHGRPTFIKLTKTEIEKWFKRIPS